MTSIRNYLLSCFGEGSGKGHVIQSRDAYTEEKPRIITLPLKEHDVDIKSQQLSDSASSLSLPAKPTTRAPTKALCVVAKHTYGIATDIPFPIINTPDEIIIRTHCVGLNPIDWKSVDYNFCMPSFPWIGGREVAGTVEEVGANVQGVKVGDRVWASTYYRDRRAGTFQEFCVVPQHTILPLPADLSFESGACLGVAALTAAMTLWKWLEVPMPVPKATSHPTTASTTPRHILIWGGSTVTGQFAIQLARQSGLSVIAITSGKTSALASRLGAEYVIVRDQKTNDEIVAEIRSITGDDLTMAIDIVGNKTGASCLKTLSTTQAGVLAPLAFLKDGEVVPDHISIAPVEMKRFIIEQGNRKYAEELNRMIADGVVALPETEVLYGGLTQLVWVGVRCLASIVYIGTDERAVLYLARHEVRSKVVSSSVSQSSVRDKYYCFAITSPALPVGS